VEIKFCNVRYGQRSDLCAQLRGTDDCCEAQSQFCQKKSPGPVKAEA